MDMVSRTFREQTGLTVIHMLLVQLLHHMYMTRDKKKSRLDGQTPWMSCNHGDIALTKKMACRENDYIKAVRGQVNGKCFFVGSGYDQVPTGQSNSQ